MSENVKPPMHPYLIPAIMAVLGFLASAYLGDIKEGSKLTGGAAISNTTRLTALETKVAGLETNILEKLGSMGDDVATIRANMKTVLTADDAQNLRRVINEVEGDLQRQIDTFRTEQKARIKQIDDMDRSLRDHSHAIKVSQEDLEDLEEVIDEMKKAR